MTTLAITPNWKNKSARFKGTVAAGEHVSVTIQNDNGEGEKVIDDASTLRLRVVGMDGRTLAIFPEPVEEGETPEAWGEADLTPLTCTLNLNTVQMLKAVPPAANVPLLFVLDDYENKTLYFKEQCPVEHWPRKFGEEEPAPTDLDDYKDIIADFNARLTTAEQTVADAATDAQNAAASASAASASAATAATAATDAQTGAIASKNAAQTAADNAANAKIAAETAQGKAEEAQEAAETAQGKAEEAAEAAAESAATFVIDDTLSVEGAAADAKAVGEANQDLITQIGTVQDNLDNEVAAREELDGAVQVDRQNLADEIARAQGAEQSLENRKADKATTYTKTEVDTKIAGVQTFQKYLVQTLPDPDEADMKGLYLVPTGETSEEGDLCEEYTVVEDSGEKRWEKIGAKAVDLTLDDTVTSSSANGVKSSGIWSAIWGALAALPTGFSSLYDWCVAQLAGKASKSDVDPLLFAQYYPDGSVKSAAEFTAGIKYGSFDDVHRTVSVLPFCNTGDSANDNSELEGRVVIPPFVDAQGNPYITDDGTRFKVVGVSGGGRAGDYNQILTAIVAPNTVTTIGTQVFNRCAELTSVSFPAATTIGNSAFSYCPLTSSVSLPSATDIGAGAFSSCSFPSVSLPVVTIIGGGAFFNCVSLTTIDFGDTPRSSVPPLVDTDVFRFVPASCKIIVPYAQYDEWKAADGWCDLQQEFVRHAEKADKPATFTAGNLAALDANGNPTNSQIPAANVALKGEIHYAISESTPLTVTSGAASTTLDDRTHNVRTVAAPGTGNTTTITATLPPIVAGKSRDMFLNLTAGTQASDAGDISLSIVEPSGATVQIDIGSVEDIGIGKNEILISENALPTTSGNVTTTHWLVTVRHEDFT